jgi:cell division protein FtsL
MPNLAWLFFGIAFIAAVAGVWQAYTLTRDLKAHRKRLDAERKALDDD